MTMTHPVGVQGFINQHSTDDERRFMHGFYNSVVEALKHDETGAYLGNLDGLLEIVHQQGINEGVDRFKRQLDSGVGLPAMVVTYGPCPGKNTCLTFDAHLPEHQDPSNLAKFEAFKSELKAWLVRNMQWRGERFDRECHAAHPFVQSDCKDYLMIEFWSAQFAHERLVNIMSGRFGFKINKYLE